MKYSYNYIKNSFHSQEAWINVFVLKYITIPLVYLMVNYTKITPNRISLLSIIFGVYSAYNYLIGNVLFGGIMYLVSYIFDATDGKVARITKTGKPYGAWLDICIDRINLVLITTAIAYNFYVNTDNTLIIFLNSLFLGLIFIGSESRYNIDYYKLKNNITDEKLKVGSLYEKWCIKKGVIKLPISLPELFLFYMVVAPNLNVELYSIFIINLFLIIRIILQQKFWYDVTKNK
ncbi:MAG: CDP-alcohol phosphatidyltransferase family protein [Flaviramulus sp.]|nr:CDP-alcohol phosphatidyltransferase family protein [Flaviramulus sp.]NNC50725.1 CDP-alcohol phosphatidyltransferase family protein [Flaviramulus sp.]